MPVTRHSYVSHHHLLVPKCTNLPGPYSGYTPLWPCWEAGKQKLFVLSPKKGAGNVRVCFSTCVSRCPVWPCFLSGHAAGRLVCFEQSARSPPRVICSEEEDDRLCISNCITLAHTNHAIIRSQTSWLLSSRKTLYVAPGCHGRHASLRWNVEFQAAVPPILKYVAHR